MPRSTKKNKTAIINIDCPYGRKLIEFVRLLKDIKIITYGFSKEADIQVVSYDFNDHGSVFKLQDSGSVYEYELPLIGKHNIYNALAAITSTVKVYGVDHKVAKTSLSKAAVIPGRLERVLKGHNIFVDYAHTDDALNNVLCIKEYFFLIRNNNRFWLWW